MSIKSKNRIFLLCLNLLLAGSNWAADGRLPQDDERWGYFAIRNHFLDNGGAPRSDAVDQYLSLSDRQQSSVTKALCEKKDRLGAPVHRSVKATYDSLLGTILAACPDDDDSSVNSVAEDLAEALVPALMPMPAAVPAKFWDYAMVRGIFLKNTGMEDDGIHYKKVVCSNAEEIFKTLPMSAQSFLMAYLALKLESRVGKQELPEQVRPLFRELFDRCNKCPRTAGTDFATLLDPKRAGDDYTSSELERAAFLLQGAGSTQEEFLAALEGRFASARALKLLEDIVTGEDHSVAEVVQKLPVLPSALANVTVAGDGAVTLEFADGGVAKTEALGEIKVLEEMTNAVAIRESIKALKGVAIPKSEKVVRTPVPATAPSKSGIIQIVDGLAQAVMMDPRFAASIVGVHNFGNARKLGGGGMNGRPAQEECLMRAMPEVLVSYMGVAGRRGMDVFLAPGDVMVTPGVGARSHIRVIAAAMPWLYLVAADGSVALHHNDEPVYGKKALSKTEYENQVETGILNVLSAAQSQGVDYFITGAWGSGVYKNSPDFVAGVFQRLLNADDGTGKPWRNNFIETLFVMPRLEKDGSASANYLVYEKTFK